MSSNAAGPNHTHESCANPYLAILVVGKLHCRHLWHSASPRKIAEFHFLAVADAEITTVIQLSGLGVAKPLQLHDGHVELTKRERERERERERASEGEHRELLPRQDLMCTAAEHLHT